MCGICPVAYQVSACISLVLLELRGPLSPVARESAAHAGLGHTCRNPFRSIVVRTVEIVYTVDEALRIISEYQRPARPFVDVPAHADIGHGVSEAPRGLLYHRYDIGEDRLLRAAGSAHFLTLSVDRR